MNDLEKTVNGLRCCQECDGYTCRNVCPYYDPEEAQDQTTCICRLAHDAAAVIQAQDEVIQELRKVGYPHDFQREKPWIVNYMHAITKVIKKAVRLNNG